MLKTHDFTKKPKKLNDLICHKSSGVTWYGNLVTSQMFSNLWNSQTETEQELVTLLTTSYIMSVYGIDQPGQTVNKFNTNVLTAYTYKNYGCRYLLSAFYEDIEQWDNDAMDFSSIWNHVLDNISMCIIANRYKWTKLYESTIAEFNPLYNVDAYEETTRTLEQDGTVRNAKTGTETSNKTGTETGKKTGTETDVKTGTETNAKTGTERTLTDESTSDRKTGTETLAKSGSEALTYNTTDTTGYAGSEATTHQKAMTTTESVTTTESSTFYDTKKTVDAGIANDNVDTLEYSQDRADTKTKTGTETTAFNSRQDQTTYNTTDTIDHDNDVTLTHNTQDQLTHNTTDTMTYNTSDQLTHNTQDQITHNTTDTETRDLLDTERILHRRYGNIGITMSTQLLESFRSFVNYHLIDIIAHDIADYITQGVY